MIKMIAGEDLKSSVGVGKDSDKTIIDQAVNSQGEVDMKVSDLIQGNFSAVDIPYIEIPGSEPLVYNEPNELLRQLNEKDEFADFDLAEEFLMFTSEIEDVELRK